MKSRGSTILFLVNVTFFVGFAHFLAGVFVVNFAHEFDEVRSYASRPWYATATIGAAQVFLFPVARLALHGGPLQSLGVWASLLNSALIGFIVAVVFALVLRTRARRPSTLWTAPILLAGLLVTPSLAASPGDTRSSTVGIPARITDLVLAGSEIEVLPQDAKTPVVLRILRVAPHGTDLRYDIEWTGLDVGRHDLRTFLRRKDGTDLANLPEIAVDVRSVLAAGMVKPNHPPDGDVPGFGGYRAWMIGLGIAWVVGLVVILLGFRKKRAADRAAAPRPRTLAERLRPLVESAMAGTLGNAERAQLELGLVAYWRRRLGLDAERPDAAIAALRAHPEAGPLLAQLDAWLHKPGPREAIDLDALLAPYRNLAPDALETGA